VKVVYLGLALLLGGGLVLFGVGAGNGLGGLLNAFTGNGSGSNQNQVVDQQATSAQKAADKNPTDPTVWANLVQARWTVAGQGSNYDTTTSAFTASGKQQLNDAASAWQRYLQLTKNPDPDVATLAARVYASLGDYSGEANAWQIVTAADPTAAKGYECLAASAYAAKNTRVGDLAEAKALTLVPKAQREILQTEINEAKTQPLVAQQC
jgi:hypothetical protein